MFWNENDFRSRKRSVKIIFMARFSLPRLPVGDGEMMGYESEMLDNSFTGG